MMSESGFFSGLSVVIAMKADEDPQWVTEMISVARFECSEIVLVVEARADVTAIRPALGAFGEKVRIIHQTGIGKADALNRGLLESKNVHVVFLDADVALEPEQLTAVLGMLQDPEDPAEFVSVAYGMRPPQIAASAFCSGWFFGAKKSTFIEVGGWSEGFVEDIETGRKIQRSKHTIRVAGFSVKLRRPVRRPATKFLSVLASFGRR